MPTLYNCLSDGSLALCAGLGTGRWTCRGAVFILNLSWGSANGFCKIAVCVLAHAHACDGVRVCAIVYIRVWEMWPRPCVVSFPSLCNRSSSFYDWVSGEQFHSLKLGNVQTLGEAQDKWMLWLLRPPHPYLSLSSKKDQYGESTTCSIITSQWEHLGLLLLAFRFVLFPVLTSMCGRAMNVQWQLRACVTKRLLTYPWTFSSSFSKARGWQSSEGDKSQRPTETTHQSADNVSFFDVLHKRGREVE